jgi:hypothetical protein
MQSPPPDDIFGDLPPYGTYTIEIEGEWSLEDLYVFPRTFEQVYFLIYSLLPTHYDLDVERIEQAYRAFPWRGGYSAVNFYNQLKYVTPRQERPQLISINYASPGWLEIGLILTVALNVEKIVKSISASMNAANDTYNNIVKGMGDRKLLRLDIRRRELDLKQDELEYIAKSVGRMSSNFGFDDSEINARTGHPYISLKILLSLYRRVRTLVDYERRGKAVFTNRRRDKDES